MAFPTLSPSARSYTPGDWAQEKYRNISGAEVRIRYGDKRTEAKLSLRYQNISDTEAELFLQDYDANYGTFKSFSLPVEVLAGWTGSNFVPDTDGLKYRYDGPPQVQSVRPGVSNLSVELVGVI